MTEFAMDARTLLELARQNAGTASATPNTLLSPDFKPMP